MQSVLNFSPSLRHTFIVGAPCSGKDILASHAIKILKQQRPDLKVYVIDIKEDPKESRYYACADFLRIQNFSTVTHDWSFDQLLEWIQHCFTEFESLNDEKLLVLSESTIIFQYFSQERSSRIWLSNKIISYLSLGNASGIYIWLIGTTITIENIGISSVFRAILDLILIIHEQNSDFYNHILRTNCLPHNCKLSVEEVMAFASPSPVKRAVYFNGEWSPMPMLDA